MNVSEKNIALKLRFSSLKSPSMAGQKVPTQGMATSKKCDKK